MTEANEKIKSLQLGLHWFAEHGGGADRMYAELVGALPSQGVACRGLVAGSNRAEIESGGVVRAFAPADCSVVRRWKAHRSAVRDELCERRPDVVVSHFAFYTFPVLGLIRKHELPLVCHFQGPWAGEGKAEGAGRWVTAAKRQLECTVYRRAKRLIVLSHAFGDLLVRDYGIDRKLVRTVRPGIDTARFHTNVGRAAARERLGWPVDRPIVLAVRRLVQRMGLENLIDAAVELRREVPDVLVLIAGKGPMLGMLEERIKATGLEQHVRMLGFVSDEDLPFAYTAADLTVVPTVELEGFGLIVVESLAAGTPVVVTPIGGLPEAVRDLSPELIMSDAGAGSIARTLTDALRSRIQLPSTSACETFAKANYDWTVVAPLIRSVYVEAIAAS